MNTKSKRTKRKKRINTAGKLWSKIEIHFIELVKRHPILYIKDMTMTARQYNNATNIAWDKIGKEANMTINTCKKVWLEIKFKYAKLQNLITSGKVSEDIIRGHPKTSKYMDGTLDFVVPYISEITDDKIPNNLHKIFEVLFGDKTDHCVAVQEDITETLRKPAKEKNNEVLNIENFTNREENNEPTTSSNNNNDGESQKHRGEPTVFIDLSLDDSVDSDITEIVTKDEIMDNIGHILPDIKIENEDYTNYTLPDNKDEPNASLTALEDFLANINCNSGDDIKKYMADLGEFLCRRLTLEKRRNLLNQIDTLVSKILEE